MKTKEEIVQNWLPRYTGEKLENFGSYNRIYGSIGAVIALMMWLYLSAYIVLFGAVLNEELRQLVRGDQ